MRDVKYSNFHTHTFRCKHALGAPIDYFNEAVAGGCGALGFSDHCPYPYSFYDSWQDVRMSESEVGDYISDVIALREKSDTKIYVGFECEWDKNFEGWYKDKLLGEFGAQYLVFGPHWLTKGNEHLSAIRIDNSADLHLYVSQIIEGMRSGLYAFVAHPDLFMARRATWGSDEIACFDAIIDAAEDLDIPLEVNGLGMIRKPKDTQAGVRFQYPHDEFWERVSGRRVRVICNADAHDPLNVTRCLKMSLSYAEKFGLNVINSIF